MRIIGGKCKGRRIVAPKTIKVRPTTDFAKEGLFNILSNINSIENKDVLDLFAGTGNISFEFASRGAKNVLSIDKQMSSVKFISEKAKELELTISSKRYDVFKFIAKSSNDTFDFIFADPPYNNLNVKLLPDLILKTSILTNDGLLILEHGNENDFSNHPNLIDKRTYSRVNFSFFKHRI